MRSPDDATVGSRLSPRVEPFAVEAVKTVVLRVFGIELLDSEACSLARSGTLTQVVGVLDKKRGIRHQGRGVRFSQRVQDQLAVQKTILELTATGDAAHQKANAAIDDLLDKYEEQAIEQRRTHQKEDEIDALLEEMSVKWRDFRSFFRKASRLRKTQLERLSVVISDDDRREIAQSKLDSLYKKYLNRAHDIMRETAE